MTERYDYSIHSSREKAADAIESYYAEGEISECEKPRIEARNGRYVVTLEAGR